MKRVIFFWVISLIWTLAVLVFQRVTGPTYPLSGTANLGEKKIQFRLQRSHAGSSDHIVTVKVPLRAIQGKIRWKHYKADGPWQEVPMKIVTDAPPLRLEGSLPHQPPAGKLVYFVHLSHDRERVSLTGDKPVVIRFRGRVPAYGLHPHIALLVFSFWFGTLAFLEALVKGARTYLFAVLTTVCFLVGGMIFGPLIQYYAFGQWWTGFPLGHDLTDTKSLASFVIWLLAIWRGRTSHLRAWVFVAYLLLMAIYLIPHSVWGSELLYTPQAMP